MPFMANLRRVSVCKVVVYCPRSSKIVFLIPANCTLVGCRLYDGNCYFSGGC
jgi:hypothetical protein